MPGTPSNIELKESEIDVTAKEEAIRAKACEGSAKAKKGSNIKIQVTPLSPELSRTASPRLNLKL